MKFKKGDKVKILGKSINPKEWDVSEDIGKVFSINEIFGDGSGSDLDNCIVVKQLKNGACYFAPKDLELMGEEKQAEEKKELKAMHEIIVHCPKKNQHLDLVEKIGWHDDGGERGYWEKYKKEFAIKIEDNKIHQFSPLKRLKEDYDEYTFYTYEEFIDKFFGKEKKSMADAPNVYRYDQLKGVLKVGDKVREVEGELSACSQFDVNDEDCTITKINLEEGEQGWFYINECPHSFGDELYYLEIINSKKEKNFMGVIKNIFKSGERKALEHFDITNGDGGLTQTGKDELMDYLWETNKDLRKDFTQKVVDEYKKEKDSK